MARQINVVEVNNFVAGLVTEASPLNFPNNASLDEENFILNRDGTRSRRLGMNLEENYVVNYTSLLGSDNPDFAITSHRWDNVGGDASRIFIVVQLGNELKIFDSDKTPVSSGLVYSRVFDGLDITKQFSYAVVDSKLVVATGLKPLSIFEYVNGSITYAEKILYIRDLFGVEDIVNGTNLRQGTGVTIRPAAGLPTQAHVYNLRNQTWAAPRKVVGPETVVDPIAEFVSKSGGKLPSNADAITQYLYADTNDSDDRLSDRFNASDLVTSPLGTFPASKGYFIIDALARGASRISEVQKLKTQYPQLTYSVNSLPGDYTPGGPSSVCEFAGRVFYAGFSGEIQGGDSNSPRLSSYVLFSQLVEDPTDITSCYQDGDPTSKEEPDLLDTDGGFIRIDGAYDIIRLINVGNGLAILASNGVWLIQGGSDYGFKATNYVTTKISTHGCDSPGSVVVIDNTFLFWSDNGIYSVGPNQYGDYVADNITQKSIQKLYDSIDGVDRRNAKGIYDTYEKKVRWLYGGRYNSVGNVRELVLDNTLGAFYPSNIYFGNSALRLPLLVSGVIVPPFRTTIVNDNVTVNGVNVTVQNEVVSVSASEVTSSTRETVYICLLSTNPVTYTFATYRDAYHRDWRSFDGTGVDAASYLVTGWMNAGDNMRDKQVPYLVTHFLKTEDGFEEDSSGDWRPSNTSSCLVQAQWAWTNSANSGRWGRQFQAYRHQRRYFPADISDSYNDGEYVVTSRSKLRGKGPVLSLKFNSEPNQHLELLGWSMVMGNNTNV